MLFLAGDIGGTKALLQLIYMPPEHATNLSTATHSNRSNAESAETTRYKPVQLAQQSYPCANFDSLESIINTFLLQALSADNLSAFSIIESDLSFATDPLRIRSACFGLPGPVSGRIVQLTNLPWVIDAQKIEQACSIQSVQFVNDFYAAAMGIQSLGADELIALYRPAEPSHSGGNRLVIGAGTGLGVAPIFYNGKEYLPVSSEGGHFDFAPISPTQQLLLSWLWQQWPHVSYERVLSGAGLEALYVFFKTVDCPVTYRLENNAQSATVERVSIKTNCFNATQNKLLSAAQITAAADQGDPIAIKALTEFVTIYGAFVGAVALIWHAPQGIYLTGGIAAKILPWMQAPYFKQAFLEKGRMSKVVATMPVFLVSDESLGLKGAMLQNQLWQTVS